MKHAAPPPSYVYGNCLFGDGIADAWALFALASHTYDCLTDERKYDVFSRLITAVEGLDADFQILRVASAWDVERYATAMASVGSTAHAQAHARYLTEHRGRLGGIGRSIPYVYIAVRLAPPQSDVAGTVSRVLERSPRAWLSELRSELRWSDRHALDTARLEDLRRRCDDVHDRLGAYLAVKPATLAEVQWLVRRAYARGLGEPEVESLHEPQALVFERNREAVLTPLEGDLLRWHDCHLTSHARHLRIESELGTSWQTLLAAGALPERETFPDPRVELMFAPVESLPFATDMCLAARFLPNELALRQVRRRIQDADQIVRAEADGDQGITDRGYERSHQARDLLALLQSPSRPPLVRATLSLAVGAPSQEALEERVALARRAFGAVRMHRPLGEQLTLFAAHLPGRAAQLAGYETVLTTEQVAAMVPTATHAAGSRAGFYLGHTLSGSRQPVRFNLREGSDTDRNTAILSLGALGTGKTTLEQKLVYEGFLQGARIVDCDPKGDHRLHLLEEVAPHTETLTIAPESRLRGILDPLRLAPDHLRQEACVSFLTDLLPARSDASWETAIVRAVDAVIAHAQRPSALEVVRVLSSGDQIDMQVGKALAVYARSGLTQLAFAAPDARAPAVGAKQVTYIPIRDLPRPDPGVGRAEYSRSERIGEQIVRLIAMLAMQLMARERERLKLFAFDEGWRLLGDPVGRLLLASLQRMGRSELAVPIISTQLVSDISPADEASLENLIGATFVFGMRSEAEAARALRLIGLDPDDARMRRRLLEFDAGRCLFRDHRGRVEAIQVDLVAPWLRQALSTTPKAHSETEAVGGGEGDGP